MAQHTAALIASEPNEPIFEVGRCSYVPEESAYHERPTRVCGMDRQAASGLLPDRGRGEGTYGGSRTASPETETRFYSGLCIGLVRALKASPNKWVEFAVEDLATRTFWIRSEFGLRMKLRKGEFPLWVVLAITKEDTPPKGKWLPLSDLCQVFNEKAHTAAPVRIPDESALAERIWAGLIKVLRQIPKEQRSKPLATFMGGTYNPHTFGDPNVEDSLTLHPILSDSLEIPEGYGWSGVLPVYVTVTPEKWFSGQRVIEGAFCSITEDGPEALMVSIKGSMPAKGLLDFLENRKESVAGIQEFSYLRSVLKHEITHAVQFRRKSAPPRDGEQTYYNDPAEFEAFLQMILHEVSDGGWQDPESIRMWYGGKGDNTTIIQGVLEDSKTWRKVKKHFTEAHKREVYKEVAKLFDERGVFIDILPTSKAGDSLSAYDAPYGEQSSLTHNATGVENPKVAHEPSDCKPSPYIPTAKASARKAGTDMKTSSQKMKRIGVIQLFSSILPVIHKHRMISQKKIHKLVKHSPERSLRYAQAINGPFPEGEEAIASEAITAEIYATRVLKDVFPAGEPAIAAHPEWRFFDIYIEFLQQRGKRPANPGLFAAAFFEEGKTSSRKRASKKFDRVWHWFEVITSLQRHKLMSNSKILKAVVADPFSSYEYAEKVIKGEFPEGEAAIARDHQTSYDYAFRVTHKRFPAGEAAIATESRDAVAYAMNILKGVFPEGEKAIAQDDMSSVWYLRMLNEKGKKPAHPELFEGGSRYASLKVAEPSPLTDIGADEVCHDQKETREGQRTSGSDPLVQGHQRITCGASPGADPRGTGRCEAAEAQEDIKKELISQGFEIQKDEAGWLIYYDKEQGSRFSLRFEDDGWYRERLIGKTGGSHADLTSIARKLMHVLPADLPLPEFKVVNQPSKRWLGEAVWSVKGGQPPETTLIHLQKSITGDEETLTRIIAHELCHHAEYFEGWRKSQEKGWDMSTHLLITRMLVPHGTEFLKWANKFNAAYGPGYVSEKSDAAMVIEETKEVFVLLNKNRQDTIYWCVSFRPSPKQKEYIKDKLEADPDSYRLIKSKDAHIIHGAAIRDGWSVPKGDDLKEKLLKLWNEGQEVKVASVGKTASKSLNLYISDLCVALSSLQRHKMISQKKIERVVLQSARVACGYAINTLGQRWEQAEPIISTDPACAFTYARYVLRPAGIPRFEMGEPAIATSPKWAYKYALEILKPAGIERFEMAEPYIAKDPGWAHSYRVDILHPAGIKRLRTKQRKTASKSLETLQSPQGDS